MTDENDSTRRSFLKAGALIAAPLATTMPASALAADGDAGDRRLADEVAIRRLHQDWLRAINVGAQTGRQIAFDGDLRSIVGDPVGEPDVIRIAADGMRATGRFACTVETVTELVPDSTFAQMANAQGGGSARISRRCVLTVDYTRSTNCWAIAGIVFDSV